MSEPFGLTEHGFKPKTFTDIKAEIEDGMRKEIDPNLHFGSGSIAGVLSAIVANQTRQVWESLAGLYHSLKPDTATGQALDALCSLTGTYRKKASYTKARASFTLESGAEVLAGAKIKSIAGDFFVSLVAAKNTFQEPKEFAVEIEAQEVGPRLSYEKSLALIMTPKSGFSKAEMGPVITLGSYDETDEELRLRRLKELKAQGASTKDALMENLQKLNGVEAVYIKEEDCAFTAIIKGGQDQEIAETIWRIKPLGVLAKGEQKVLIVDQFKHDQPIGFSRPKNKPLVMRANVILKENSSIDIETKLKTLILGYAQKHFNMGTKVYASHFIPALLAHPEVLDVKELEVRDKKDGLLEPAFIKENEIPSLSFDQIFITWPQKSL